MNPTNLLTLNKDQEVEVNITSLAHGGSGVGRFNDFVLFTPYTAPGDKVRVKVSNVKKNFAEAELVQVIEPSAHRVTPPCEVFGKCGGCQWQHVSYDEQLKQKQNIVEHALKRIAKEENVAIKPIIASPKPYNYRNRAQFRTQGPKAGFYQRGSHNLIEFKDCKIIEEPLNLELQKIKTEIKNAPADKVSKIEVLMTPEGNTARSKNKAHGEELGFSQVNTSQNKRMQDYVCKVLGKPQTVDKENTGVKGHLLDLYCGNGNFSLPLNENGWHVYGVDANKQAIIHAKAQNKPLSLFLESDCSAEVKRLATKDRNFEAIVIDPPRIGADERLWANLAKLNPDVIVYVSCDPATFARDWARLRKETGFILESVQPFDMFPQTFHVELVAVAKRPT